MPSGRGANRYKLYMGFGLMQLNTHAQLGTKELAAVDSCFILVRARQHCIARH